MFFNALVGTDEAAAMATTAATAEWGLCVSLKWWQHSSCPTTAAAAATTAPLHVPTHRPSPPTLGLHGI